MKIYDGERTDIGVRSLTPGGTVRLIVIVAANTVGPPNFDGVNDALTELTALHAEVGEAIDALAAARGKIHGPGSGTEEGARS